MIQFDQVYKSFDNKQVLSGLDLAVPEGQALAILGRSGTGKSVMLRHLTGGEQADKGRVSVFGSRPSARALLHMGFLFQNGALFDSLTVWENIAFGLIHQQGMPPAKARAEAENLLSQLDLDPSIATLMPRDLSGGMAKRVALGRAIATKPKLLLCDEPTTGLDPISGRLIDELIKRLQIKLGMTCLVITHDLASAKRIADRIVLLDQGRIAWDGSVQALDKADHPLIQQFLGNEAHG